MDTLKTDFENNIALLDGLLRVNESFDMIALPIEAGGRRTRFYMIDGFAKDGIMLKIMQFMQENPDLAAAETAAEYARKIISYTEVEVTKDLRRIETAVLSGAIALVVEPFDEVIIIDAREYPVRSVGEPEDDKVLRGSHVGFVETLVFNTALLRRHIRDRDLTMELFTVGRKTKTDIVMAYMDGKADPRLLKKIRSELEKLDIPSVSMAQESLTEALVKKGWYNPFPKVRYSERPDVTAANIMDGKIVILVDNSPAAITVPVSVFDFVQQANDYYFPPLVGTYLRIVRLILFFLTIFLTPVWYVLVKNPESIPQWLQFIAIEEPAVVPVFLQLLVFELVIEGLRLASLNTPSGLANAFSVVAALILGEYAVQAHWLNPEVILYMGFVAMGNYTQPSYELGYAFKLMRILMIVLIALIDVWGLIAGIVLIALLLAVNRTVAGTSYLYPLIPFDRAEFKKIFSRTRLHRNKGV